MATNEPSGGNPSPPGRSSASSGDSVDSGKKGFALSLNDPHHPLNFLVSMNEAIHTTPLYMLKPHVSERVDDLTKSEYTYTLTVPYEWLKTKPRFFRSKLLWWLIKFAFKCSVSNFHA